ncbi:MAG TPA: nicotinate-nucleotide--dimethylbenzimidazole phosphoribosyltransferase [Jatrophihabitantaceae bacterium]|nr:nicotinate-nucleotide--dimethylbenzimidazole phosphoribosyltransferase [Jatrophihabitantaceae bacterium]
MDLVELGADVEWPDSEASSAVRERLVGRPELGRLAWLAEWAVGVRPAGTSFGRARALIVGGEPGELVLDTAAAVDAGVAGVAAEGDLAAGVAIADDEIERGTELLIVSVPEMRADAAIAVSVLTDTEPVKVLARGAAATDPDAWMQLAIEVRDARRRCLTYRDDPDGLLTELGSSRLRVVAGIVLRATGRRTPVLLDGPVACAGALIAYEAAPRAVRWWAAADQGPDPLHEIALTRLGQEPILGVGSGLGDGLAGLLALPVLRAAATVGSG